MPGVPSLNRIKRLIFQNKYPIIIFFYEQRDLNSYDLKTWIPKIHSATNFDIFANFFNIFFYKFTRQGSQGNLT